MARAKKVLTDEQRDRLKDKRLQKQYGISLVRQKEILREQNNQCKTCKIDFTPDNPPNTDHFHYKIQTRKLGKKNWEAVGIDERGLSSAIVTAWSPTKIAAIAGMKQLMGPGSVRGLLCRKCNRGLGYIERFFNAAHHPENLYPVIEYFRARITN